MDIETAGSAYLVDVTNGDSLKLQYAPNELADSKGTSYASVKIPGMSGPRQQFVSGDAHKLALKIDLYGNDVAKNARWIQSLEYPEYENDELVDTPHRVMFIFGTLYGSTVWLVTDCQVKYFGQFTPGLDPRRAEVSLTLEEYVTKGRDYRNIRNQGAQSTATKGTG